MVRTRYYMNVTWPSYCLPLGPTGHRARVETCGPMGLAPFSLSLATRDE